MSGERVTPNPQVVGRVVATELKPSTPHQFWFWTAPESAVGIGTIVRVDAEERTVFGVVTDGVSYSDDVEPRTPQGWLMWRVDRVQPGQTLVDGKPPP